MTSLRRISMILIVSAAVLVLASGCKSMIPGSGTGDRVGAGSGAGDPADKKNGAAKVIENKPLANPEHLATVVWKTRFKGNFPRDFGRSVAVAGPVVIVQVRGLRALDRKSGKVRWSDERTPGFPAVSGDVAFSIRSQRTEPGKWVPGVREEDPFRFPGAGPQELVATEASSGKAKWSSHVKGLYFYDRPLLAGGTVIVCGEDPGHFCAGYDTTDGRLLWKARFGAQPRQLQLAEGDLYLISGKTVYRIDIISGSKTEVTRLPSGGHQLLVTKESLFAQDLTGDISSAPSDGSGPPKQRLRASRVTEELMEPSPPFVASLSTLVRTEIQEADLGYPERVIRAVDTRTWRARWSVKVDRAFISHPLLDGENVIFATNGETDSPSGARDEMPVSSYAYTAYDLVTGSPVWTFTLGLAGSYSIPEAGPSLDDSAVYAVENDEKDHIMYALDRRTGAELWRFKAPGSVAPPTPLPGSNQLVVGVGKSFYLIEKPDLNTGDKR